MGSKRHLLLFYRLRLGASAWTALLRSKGRNSRLPQTPKAPTFRFERWQTLENLTSQKSTALLPVMSLIVQTCSDQGLPMGIYICAFQGTGICQPRHTLDGVLGRVQGVEP